MTPGRLSRFAVACSVAVGILGCANPTQSTDESKPPIVGVKIYETDRDLPGLFEEWGKLGVNTVFASRSLASAEGFRSVAERTGTDVFVIFPVFFAPDELAANPDLWAITADGQWAKEDWVEFACPSNLDFRAKRIEEAREVVREIHPTGLSIDFIRHFVFWETVEPERDPATLPDSCYCIHCVQAFANAFGLPVFSIPPQPQRAAAWIRANAADRWVEFKKGLITSMAVEIAEAVREIDPGIRIGLHTVPWRREDFDGSLLRVAGQDVAALSEVADFLSPMAYSFMLHRPPEWVASVVGDVAQNAACAVLPSIQVATAYREDEVFDLAEFEAALRATLAPPSAGVVFWSWDHIQADPERADIIRRVMREDVQR